MFWTIAALFISTTTAAFAPAGDVYTAWTDHGYHLMICDNGTPEDLEDDFICDWEDNRDFTIIVNDK